ncbi:hypothetical protein N7532_003991 [Penicillium argentinense]|uniref:Uncharacterized protein n=1 Tax=Penicillium argentinense TaxID=1131581 RepID=A0A9W9FP08_9EURO|nr:uncharacterized protein N7532_003991 [Penicillium argentinense]KAJ5103462.1 hypothetical protein N7532_003991 [Penicillium argentinense]
MTSHPHVQATAGFPSDGEPEKVNLIFWEFLGGRIVTALNTANPPKAYSISDSRLYLPKEFTTNSFIPKYVSLEWQNNIDNCKID